MSPDVCLQHQWAETFMLGLLFVSVGLNVFLVARHPWALSCWTRWKAITKHIRRQRDGHRLRAETAMQIARERDRLHEENQRLAEQLRMRPVKTAVPRKLRAKAAPATPESETPPPASAAPSESLEPHE